MLMVLNFPTRSVAVTVYGEVKFGWLHDYQCLAHMGQVQATRPTFAETMKLALSGDLQTSLVAGASTARKINQ